MLVRPAQIEPSVIDGQVLKTVSGRAIWETGGDLEFVLATMVDTLVAGDFIQITWNDMANTITIEGIDQYTAEAVRDAVAAALVEGTDIQIDIDDGGNTITISALHTVPGGGTTGQLLGKLSDTTYDYDWVDNEGGGGGLPTIEWDAGTTYPEGAIVTAGGSVWRALSGSTGVDPTVVVSLPVGGTGTGSSPAAMGAQGVTPNISGTATKIRVQFGGGGTGVIRCGICAAKPSTSVPTSIAWLGYADITVPTSGSSNVYEVDLNVPVDLVSGVEVWFVEAASSMQILTSTARNHESASSHIWGSTDYSVDVSSGGLCFAAIVDDAQWEEIFYLPGGAYSLTPTGTADTAGSEGDLTYDDDYLYVKTGAGWARTALSTF